MNRSTLTARAVILTCLVAVVSVAITAAVALPLSVRSANDEARRTLALQARVAANAIDFGPGGQREEQRAQRVAQTLRDQDIETVLIRAGQPDQPGLPSVVVTEVASGGTVSRRVLYQGRLMMAEGRPAGGGNGLTGTGDGIVLLQSVSAVSLPAILGRLWLALVAGLVAGVVAGVLLARRLGRPLRQVAMAARRLSAGDRTTRAPTDAPAEVADVSVALNDLATALTTSENRQRTFLLSISHELRTPLTTMKGYAEALADGVIGPEGAQRAGQTMLAESEHLDRLVEDLLVLARLEADDFPLECMSVDLVALVATAAESWGGRCAALGVVLRTELPSQPLYVRTDPGRTRQVLDGLLENALRVVPEGGPVVIAVRTSSGSSGSPGSSVSPVSSGSSASGPSTSSGSSTSSVEGVVEVRDGGPGFTDDDLAVAFERGALYERYRGVRKVGSGLGLALAHRLVARLGGRIEAGHAPEGGARMTVRLPLT